MKNSLQTALNSKICKRKGMLYSGTHPLTVLTVTFAVTVLVATGLTNCGRTGAAGPVRFEPAAVPYKKLSDYAFFTDLPAQTPNERVLPYDLITPLFTDYAHKARFVWMPEGVKASVNEAGELEFPDQTVLIKTFYYPADFRQPKQDWDGIETRLLVKLDGKWQAYTYVWNDEQTDGALTRIGAFRDVAWMDLQGDKRQIQYVVPNQNQCKSCHNRDNEFMPIGPKVRNLNKSLSYPDGRTANQLARWQEAGLLAAGDWAEQYTPIADWEDAESRDLEHRALAYLDVNCGHCHRSDGPAHTTGLYLTYEEAERHRLGICKTPVAAGKGSGGRRFGIEPGEPDSSILVFRMESDDPGVMMPELGRVIPHDEGIELVRAWIAGLEGECR